MFIRFFHRVDRSKRQCALVKDRRPFRQSLLGESGIEEDWICGDEFSDSLTQKFVTNNFMKLQKFVPEHISFTQFQLEHLVFEPHTCPFSIYSPIHQNFNQLLTIAHTVHIWFVLGNFDEFGHADQMTELLPHSLVGCANHQPENGCRLGKGVWVAVFFLIFSQIFKLTIGRPLS